MFLNVIILTGSILIICLRLVSFIIDALVSNARRQDLHVLVVNLSLEFFICAWITVVFLTVLWVVATLWHTQAYLRMFKCVLPLESQDVLHMMLVAFCLISGRQIITVWPSIVHLLSCRVARLDLRSVSDMVHRVRLNYDSPWIWARCASLNSDCLKSLLWHTVPNLLICLHCWALFEHHLSSTATRTGPLILRS